MKQIKQIVAYLCLMISGMCVAQETTTLEGVDKKSAIHLGVVGGAVPFSYPDDNLHYDGYSVALCGKIVDAVQQKIGKPVKVVQVPVTPSTWMEDLKARRIDIVCDAVSNTVERNAHVAFSVTNFIATGRIVSRKGQAIRTVQDLAGKTVVATAGSTLSRWLIEQGKTKMPDSKLVMTRDFHEAFNLLESGRADAMVMDDILIAGLLARARQPQEYVVSEEVLSVEPYGLMIRKDDPSFKALVDQTLVGLYRSGEIHHIYAQWFTSPLPPDGMNLHLPMTPQLKAVFKKYVN